MFLVLDLKIMKLFISNMVSIAESLKWMSFKLTESDNLKRMLKVRGTKGIAQILNCYLMTSGGKIEAIECF